MNKHFIRGFTLIELMIVVGIIGILAAIAYPSYNESILKGRRAEGRTAIMDLMQQQERYLTQNGTYLPFTNSTTGVTVPAVVPFKTYSGENNVNGFYFLSAAQCPAVGAGAQPPLTLCIQISAAPKQTDARAGTLTMDSTGVKSCSVSGSKVCW